MHFTQIFAAVMALPALSMAAAVPRSNGFKACSNFATNTVGILYVNTQNLNMVQSVNVQIRADGTGQEGWKTIATVPKGANGQAIDAGQWPGVWNVQICDSLPYLSGGGLCVAPDGYNKLWRFRASGDRWYFNTAIRESGPRVLSADCLVSDLKVTDTPTVTVTATPAPTLPPTTSNAPTTSIKTTSSSSTSTRSNPTTSSTSTRTTSSSTRTSTTSTRATTTSARTSSSSTKTPTATSTRSN